MPQTVDFALCNAFSRSSHGGNPAATFFLAAPLDAVTYQRIAGTFNQPIHSFVIDKADEDEGNETDTKDTKRFIVRWFTPKVESPICGHGTVAAAYYMFATNRMPPNISTLIFENETGELFARKIITADDAPSLDFQIEIELQGFELTRVDDEIFQIAKQATAKALRRANVNVTEVLKHKHGQGGTEQYLLIVLGSDEALSGVEVEPVAFLPMLPFRINILTVKSRLPGVLYETRMFAPFAGVPEDHVCGSANCLLGPYWAEREGLESNELMHVKQGSERSGDLWVRYNRDTKKIALRGEAVIVAEGKAYL